RLEIFQRMMAGKKLIGIPANYNATHALMQGSGMELVKPVLFNGKEGKDLGLKYVIDSIVTVTSDIAQFLASVVDNGKNPLANLYNLNTYTADVAMLITKFFGKETSMKFIAQPIVTEFYQRYVNEGGNSKAETKVATELLGLSKKDYFNMLKEEDVNLDDTQLEEGLRDKINSNPQKEILKQFLRYKKNQAKDLGTLVNAIKVPDNGMRSSLEKTITGIDRVAEAKNLTTITNVEEFFDNLTYANNIMYEEGITKAMNKFVELGFPNYQGSTAYTKLREYFTEQKGSNLDERELTLLHDTSVSYLSSGFQPLDLDRMEVIKTTPKLLIKFKGTNPIAYSKFINSLNVDKSEQDDSLEVITLASGLSKEAENDIINQWEMLLDSPIQEERVLGNSLVQYAYISNGFRFSPGSLAHIQPISAYENLVNGEGKDYHTFIAQQIESANQDENFLEGFKEQFVRHYFPRLSYVKSYDKDSAFIRYDDKTKEP
ncbi:MAG TPA: hypothetical protein PLG47_05925, partial [Candidatus Dojkabacteria bacterium]|nr:hypothetical protein [Candidatus Dojkabacteria bacterium]